MVIRPALLPKGQFCCPKPNKKQATESHLSIATRAKGSPIRDNRRVHYHREKLEGTHIIPDALQAGLSGVANPEYANSTANGGQPGIQMPKYEDSYKN